MPTTRMRAPVDSTRYRAGMNAARVMPVAAVLLLALAGCGPDKNPSTPEPSVSTPGTAGTAHPGSYCQQAGQRATTDAGRPVVCTTSSTDSRLRWRADR